MTHMAGIRCARCDQQLPAHATECPGCRTPTPFTPARLREMGVDVNARVMWGDSPQEIRDAWLKKGAPAEALDQALGAAARERRAHFRQLGLRDILIALGLFVVGAIGFWITRVEASGEAFQLGGRASLIVGAAAFGAPLAGIFLGGRGLRRMTRGGGDGEGASEIDHSD
jgi:hypothetical protein